MMTTVLALVAVALLTAADQLSKYLIAARFEVGESVHVVPGLLDFTYVRNRGAAFGMLADRRWIFLLLTTLIIAGIVYAWHKNYVTHLTGRIAAVLIVAGGIGNMIDRLCLGYVVDFIDVSPLFPFAVFNVADCCVTVGAVFMAVFILFFMEEKSPAQAAAALPEEDAGAEPSEDKDA